MVTRESFIQMNREEIEENYPKTAMCLRALWYDNVPFNIDNWQPNFTADYIDWDKLESEARHLIGDRTNAQYIGDDSDFEQFVYGPVNDELESKYPYLNKFLYECFEGELAEQFIPNL